MTTQEPSSIHVTCCIWKTKNTTRAAEMADEGNAFGIIVGRREQTINFRAFLEWMVNPTSLALELDLDGIDPMKLNGCSQLSKCISMFGRLMKRLFLPGPAIHSAVHPSIQSQQLPPCVEVRKHAGGAYCTVFRF